VIPGPFLRCPKTQKFFKTFSFSIFSTTVVLVIADNSSREFLPVTIGGIPGGTTDTAGP
jgi:hypothetical protein